MRKTFINSHPPSDAVLTQYAVPVLGTTTIAGGYDLNYPGLGHSPRARCWEPRRHSAGPSLDLLAGGPFKSARATRRDRRREVDPLVEGRSAKARTPRCPVPGALLPLID